MDQREGQEEQADCRSAREMQCAAISAGKEAEPGCPPPTALQVSVRLYLLYALLSASCKRPLGPN